MAVTVEMQNTGDSDLKADVVASIRACACGSAWGLRVSIIGSQANDRWEMKIIGPNAFEWSYTLEASSGQHRPEMIRAVIGQLLPPRKE